MARAQSHGFYRSDARSGTKTLYLTVSGILKRSTTYRRRLRVHTDGNTLEESQRYSARRCGRGSGRGQWGDGCWSVWLGLAVCLGLGR